MGTKAKLWMILFILTLCGITVLANSSVSVKEASSWQLIGPGGGGHLTSLVVDNADPDLLFTSVNCGGVRRSFNGGATWEMCNDSFDYAQYGLRAHKIGALIQHPTLSQVLLASSHNGQIFTSTDHGTSWQVSYAVSGAPSGQSFNYFLFDPANPDTVYTSSGDVIDRLLTPSEHEKEAIKILNHPILRGQRQADNQWVWTVLGELRDFENNPVPSYSGAVNPQVPQEMFFVTGAGLYRGTIEGDHVTPVLVDPVQAGLPEKGSFNGGKIIFDPRHAGLAFMSVISVSGSGGGFYKSVDAGQTWHKIIDGLDPKDSNFYDIQFHPTNDQVLYLGQFFKEWLDEGLRNKRRGALYRSTDLGESWQKITALRKFEWGWKVLKKTMGVQYIATSLQRPDALLMTASGGQVFITDNALAKRPAWRQITTQSLEQHYWTTTGLEAIGLPQSLAIDPEDPRMLYIPYSDHGMFRSSDGGASLHFVSKKIPSSGTLIFDALKHGRLYLALQGPHLALETGKVMMSEDYGATWQVIGGGQEVNPDLDLPPGAMTGMLIQYLEGGQRNLYVCNYTYGVYVKAGDNAWRRILAQPGCRALTQRNQFQELYVGVDSVGIYRLVNSGEAWQSTLIAPASARIGKTFYDFETGSESNTVYFASSKGVFAVDASNQITLKLDMPDAMAFEVHPNNESLMYAASPYTGVWKSVDRGATWSDLRSELPGTAVMVLKISPSEPDTIYAASRCSGIWKKSFSAP